MDVWVGPGESLIHWIVGCGAAGTCAGRRKSEVLPVLFYRCETWTLTRDLRWRLNSFGTRSLRRNLGDRWSDFVSEERLLRETQMRFGTCIVTGEAVITMNLTRRCVVKLSSNLSAFYSAARDRAGPIMLGDLPRATQLIRGGT